MRARLRAVRGSRGSVTAEVALALPALLLVTFALVVGVVIAAQQVRCQDAASAVARAIARGEDPIDVERLLEVSAPTGAVYRARSDADQVTVRIEWHLPSAVGPIARWAPTVNAESVASVEQ